MSRRLLIPAAILIIVIFGAFGLWSFAQLFIVSEREQDAYFVIGAIASLISFFGYRRLTRGPNTSANILTSHRHPNVYEPDEALPEPGKKESFFAKGGFVNLLILLAIFGFVFWYRINGYSAAVHEWVKHLIFG